MGVVTVISAPVLILGGMGSASAEGVEGAEERAGVAADVSPGGAAPAGAGAQGDVSQEAESNVPPNSEIPVGDSRMEASADILKRGYPQRAVLSGTNVQIYDHPGRGGQLLYTFKALDHADWKRHISTPHGSEILDGGGLWSSRIAASEGAVFVTQPINKPANTAGYTHQSEIRRYKITEEKADPKSESSFSHERTNVFTHGRHHVVTAMAVGKVGGEEVLAVGLNKGGVRIHRASNLGTDLKGGTEAKYEALVGLKELHGLDPVNMVTALRFGPSHDGKPALAVGLATEEDPVIRVIDPTGGPDIRHYVWHPGAVDWRYWTYPLSFAFGKITKDGKNVLAAGMSRDDGTRLYHLESDGHYLLSSGNAGPRGLTFFTDRDGNPKLSAFIPGGGTQIYQADGSLLKPLGPGMDDGEIRDAVPGWHTVGLQAENATGREIELGMSASKESGRGCWRNGAFPSETETLEPGKAGALHGTSFLSDPGGTGCQGVATGDERSFYLTAKVGGEDWTRQIAKVTYTARGNGKPELKIEEGDSVGGNTLTAALEPVSDSKVQPGHILDYKIRITEKGDSPTATTAPTLIGHRLTAPSKTGAPIKDATDDPYYPVYRVDVKGAQWNVPGADQKLPAGERLTATSVPAMRVQGNTGDTLDDEEKWDDLGLLMPATSPTRNGNDITLGDSEFYWQNSPDGRQYTHLRVINGNEDNEKITVIDLESLTPPEIEDYPIKPSAEPINPGNSVHNTRVRANGLDQGAFRLVIAEGDKGTGNTLPPDNWRYDKIYYRDTSRGYKLLTGLIPVDGSSQHASLSSIRGAYSDDALDIMSANSEKRHYLSTGTEGISTTLQAYVSLRGISSNASGPFGVESHRTPQSVEGSGAEGLSVPGCVEGNCQLASRSPSVFRHQPKGGQPEIGLLINPRAFTSGSTVRTDGGTLPLPSDAPLASADLDFHNGRAHLSDHNSFTYKGDYLRFDTHLVTHGELLEARK
ncbi:hypothetical protein ABT187_48090 [Streptomyces sp. NPDC001817]|uniref:hypothetical protein n=1 Tax=Streptomyces sp. NPDC001817 TaxID=3154398 RepID=UPI0033250C55